MTGSKFVNASLVVVVLLIVVGLFGLSSVFAGSHQGGQVTLLASNIDVQATARAIQVENQKNKLVTAAQKRLNSLQVQIQQARRSGEELDQLIAAQTSQQEQQLAALQQEALEQQQQIEKLRSTALFLQDTLSQEESEHSLRLDSRETEFRKSEEELRAVLAAMTTELNAAWAQLAAQQLAPTAETVSPLVAEDGRAAEEDNQVKDGNDAREEDHNSEDNKDHNDEDSEEDEEDEEDEG
jgi:hypothetical protein